MGGSLDTPVEAHGHLWFKRDDLFELSGMYGAKVRACLALCERAKNQGYTRVVSAGSRYSPQLAILGTVANHLGLKAVGITAKGESLPFIQQAESLGVEVHKIPYGYTNVIHKRARDFADALGAYLVPFGMRDDLSVYLTAESFVRSFEGSDVLGKIKRLVVAAGSGVNLAGSLTGMRLTHISTLPVLAVLVGHDCREFVYKRCPWVYHWDNISFVRAGLGYKELSLFNQVNGISVDSRYEGKAVMFLEEGDLFWLIGKAVSSPVVISREV